MSFAYSEAGLSCITLVFFCFVHLNSRRVVTRVPLHVVCALALVRSVLKYCFVLCATLKSGFRLVTKRRPKSTN